MKQSIFLLLGMFASLALTAQQETRSLEPFTKIRLEGAGKIYLTQDNDHDVTVILDDKGYSLEDIKTYVQGGTLVIDYESQGWLDNAPDVEFWITYDKIEEIRTEGASNIRTENIMRGDKLLIYCSGAQKAKMDLEVGKLEAVISGAGTFNFKGAADEATLEVDGAGKIKAEDLICTNVNASVDGVGSIRVHATNSIDGSVSGVGNIRFAGNPAIQNLSSDGIGSVKAIK